MNYRQESAELHIKQSWYLIIDMVCLIALLIMLLYSFSISVIGLVKCLDLIKNHVDLPPLLMSCIIVRLISHTMLLVALSLLFKSDYRQIKKHLSAAKNFLEVKSDE